ncbi:MAG: IMP cyclohydrolase [Planctomycetes bacterium]|nr:IMP cyclohydrolase [Planctomycetota bacterium]
MYLGRIVAVGRTKDGAMSAMYRVSSRSFPNRRANVSDKGVSIVPKEGHEGDVYKNPYIAYNCAKIVGEIAIATNGSQTDPIAEKIASGMNIRDALVYSLAVMDYEKDDYNTPRIAAVVEKGSDLGWLGVVRHDGLDVQSFHLAPGKCVHISTYEHNIPDIGRISDFGANNAAIACDHVLGGGVFAGFTNPVTAVCLVENKDGFEIAAKDAQ